VGIIRNCGCEWGSRQVSTISDAGTRVEFCRQQYLELIEACVLLGFSQFAVAFCPFLVFSFISYLGISSIAAIAIARYGVSE